MIQNATYARRSSRQWSGRKTARNGLETLASHAVLTRRGRLDASGFIRRYSDNLSLEWSTYFGGEGFETISDIEIKEGGVIITGDTHTDVAASQNMSNTPCGVPGDGSFPDCAPGGAYHQTWGGGNPAQVGDNFISEFNENGVLIWSTHIGGAGDESASIGTSFSVKSSSLALSPVDETTIALLGYTTNLGAFPHTTYSGGGAYSQISGFGYFVIRFNNRIPVWSSGFGCFLYNNYNYGSITLDENEIIYIAGTTNCDTPADEADYCDVPPSGDFPICIPSSDIFFQTNDTPVYGGGISDGFIAAFNNVNQLGWSTYFGGNLFEGASKVLYSIENSSIYLAGTVESTSDFPLRNIEGTNDYFESEHAGGLYDGFLSRLDVTSIPVIVDLPNIYSAKSVKIFPNPTTNQLFIELPGEEVQRLEIYSTDGRLLKTEIIEHFSTQTPYSLCLEGILPGAYVLRLVGPSYATNIKFLTFKP